MFCNYNILNGIIVGLLTSFVGSVIILLTSLEKNNKAKKRINICKNIIIFFIIGFIVHLIIEYFNFNEICYDKKCYSNLCHNNLCKVK